MKYNIVQRLLQCSPEEKRKGYDSYITATFSMAMGEAKHTKNKISKH